MKLKQFKEEYIRPGAIFVHRTAKKAYITILEEDELGFTITYSRDTKLERYNREGLIRVLKNYFFMDFSETEEEIVKSQPLEDQIREIVQKELAERLKPVDHILLPYLQPVTPIRPQDLKPKTDDTGRPDPGIYWCNKTHMWMHDLVHREDHA